MEIRLLQTFLQAAALKNFTLTAKALGYSQSNVSAQIQQLEQELGAPLFNRIGKSVTLTQYGEQLIPHARELVSMSVRLENFMKSEEALGGTIHVGIVESLFQCFIEPVILRYHQDFPNVNIELTVDSTSALKELLANGQLDMACLIDTLLPEAKWNIWYKKAAPIRIVAPCSHPLADECPHSLSELKNEKFILMEDSASYIIAFQNAMTEHKVPLHAFLKLQNAETACSLVQKGNFFSILPHYVVSRAAQAKKVALLNIPEFSYEESIYLLMHNSRVLTPQMEGFLNIFKKILSPPTPSSLPPQCDPCGAFFM